MITLEGRVMMKRSTEVKRYLRNFLRIYFAPFIGAYRQMRYELRRRGRDLHRN